jgi:methyl-accepting chemotaxis protein
MQTAEGAQESQDAGDRLNQLASEMTGLIGKFRIKPTKEFSHVKLGI